MSIRLYHQVGHNPNWNRESFVTDNCGDGLILSPVHQSKPQIDQLSVKIRRVSVFDPQYYLPNSQKPKLQTYKFFPDTLSGGFSTKGFASLALDSAKQCLQFQITNQFAKLIIPARHFDQMDPEFTEKQDTYTVEPFLKAAHTLGAKKPIYLTLPLTSHMLESKKYRTSILNWVTSFPEIAGLYIFASNARDTKQPQSQDFLSAYLNFLRELKEVELELLVGYLNTEALLMTLIDDISITMGTFENTRMFSIDKFIVSNEDRRGPRARIYLSGLLNWIQFDEAKQIRRAMPKLWQEIYEENEYGDSALAAMVEPTFNQPALYKHHFLCFQRQVDELKACSVAERYELLKEWITNAIEYHKDIHKRGISLEKHGAGSHLLPWLKAIDAYAADYL